MEDRMILAATGHRPDKLGGYGQDVSTKLRAVAAAVIQQHRPFGVISGMALGWDTAWAEAALDAGVPLLAAVPFAGQESRWPQESQRRFRSILERAAKIVTVCDGGYAAWKMQRRNEYMVEHCSALVALWNGTTGGTGNCVAYAERVQKPIINVWDDWRAIQSPEAA